jgi:hypothetical protein
MITMRRLTAVLLCLRARAREDRGDVPGWVMVTVVSGL